MIEVFFVVGMWAGIKGGSALAYWQHEREQKRNAERANAEFQGTIKVLEVADRQFSDAYRQVITNLFSV